MNRRAGWNPTRRNRNIGTSKQGRGKNNRLVIPESWHSSKIYWESLNNPVAVPQTVNGKPLTILVEPTNPGFVHACTIDDIVALLGHIPNYHLEQITTLVLRQPKKKENLLKPMWGRLQYWSDVGPYSGPTIYLEAQLVDTPVKWSRHLSPDDDKELARLKADGHKITRDKRYYFLSNDLQAIRNTQLYRTLPHEIGHYVDYLVHVEEPSNAVKNEAERDWITNQYWSKSTLDKEAFAHRYAEEFYTRMNKKGILPFDRICHPEKMKEQGLDPAWFNL